MGVKQHGEEEDDDDDGDLSMVSDASSGPRQKFAEDDQEKVYGERKKGRSKKEKKFNDVDDTVSSPVFTSTSKVIFVLSVNFVSKSIKVECYNK